MRIFEPLRPREMFSISAGVLAVFLSILYNAYAFTGPSTTAGTGGGAIITDSSNNVIIGTSTSPAARLYVYASSSDSVLSLDRRSASYPTTFRLGADGVLVMNAGNADTLTLKAGNVGVGTTSPGYPLAVAGTIYSSTGGFRFPDGTTQTTASTGGSGSVSTSSAITAGYFPYWANTTGGLTGTSTLYQSGTNIGIGMTGPNTKLQVVGGNIQMDNGQGLYFFTAGGAAATNNGITGSDATDKLTFRTAGQDRMTISGGNVGIGTSSPSTNLDVVGSINTSANYQVNGSTRMNGGAEYTQLYRGNSGVIGIYLANTGAANYYDNTTHYFRGSAGTGTFLTLNSSYASFPEEVRGTTFSDYSNTAYYVDPAGTSNLNAAAFASTVTGQTPAASNQFATKGYVDALGGSVIRSIQYITASYNTNSGDADGIIPVTISSVTTSKALIIPDGAYLSGFSGALNTPVWSFANSTTVYARISGGALQQCGSGCELYTWGAWVVEFN